MRTMRRRSRTARFSRPRRCAESRATASLVRILESGSGEPLDVGRKTRVIPPAMHRALKRRDRGCRFPGCVNTRFVDGHHIRHWADGGATCVDNLVLLCRHHHRLLHEGGYYVVKDGAEFIFCRGDGELISPRNECRGPHPIARRGRLVELPGVSRALTTPVRRMTPPTTGDADAAARLTYHVARDAARLEMPMRAAACRIALAVVAARAVTERDAGGGIAPCDLAAGAAVAERERRVGVTEAARVAVFVTGDYHAECAIHRNAHQIGVVVAHLQRRRRASACARSLCRRVRGRSAAPGRTARGSRPT